MSFTGRICFKPSLVIYLYWRIGIDSEDELSSARVAPFLEVSAEDRCGSQTQAGIGSVFAHGLYLGIVAH